MERSAARQALRGAVAPSGLFEASADELHEAHALAARLISPDIASPESLAAIHARTGYGVYVTRGESGVTGFLAFIMLNIAGLHAVETDAFDPVHPQLEYIIGPSETPAAIYCWGIAAARRRAAADLVAGSWAARAALPHIPYFVRAATDNGRRLLTTNMAFTPYPGTTTGLLWWPTFEDGRRSAA